MSLRTMMTCLEQCTTRLRIRQRALHRRIHAARFIIYTHTITDEWLGLRPRAVLNQKASRSRLASATGIASGLRLAVHTEM